MEDLYLLQENTLEAISKAATNFRKSPKSRLTKSFIQVKLETLERYWHSFSSTHLEILKSAQKEQKKKDDYFLKDIFNQGEEAYTGLKCEMLDLLQDVNETVIQSVKERVQEVKLPKINIPIFSGNYNDWSTFQDLYISLIHANTTLSNVQKMHYLKGSVAGEAEQLLKHIQVTERNYDLAWNTLKQRYNNKRIMVNTILNRFLGHKRLSSDTSRGIKELLDTARECLNSLKNLDIDVQGWDPLVIHIIVTKLDIRTHQYWEEELNGLPIDELPELEGLFSFLEKRFRVLEMMQMSHAGNNSRNVATKSFYSTSEPANPGCIYCNGNHNLQVCKDFGVLNIDRKWDVVQSHRLCFNCLWPGHVVRDCRHTNACRRCKRRHHTLLHNLRNNNESVNEDEPIAGPRESVEANILSHVSTRRQATLLATALVGIQTGKGVQLLRALIDPCSQETFISEVATRKLQLKCLTVDGQVSGVGKMCTPIKQAAEIELTSIVDNTFKLGTTAYVIKQITDIMPASKVDAHIHWDHIKNLKLADPTYHTPGQIDILLGVNIYTEIMMSGIIKGVTGTPMAQQTKLGWVLSGGTLENVGETQHNFVSMHLAVNLEHMLQRFWESETLEDNINNLTSAELQAEKIYEQTVKRTDTGRYIVALPFIRNNPVIPTNSKTIAIRRLKSLESKLRANKGLRNEYNKVMEEYLALRHMEAVENEVDVEAVYLPHHAVVREDKETTKLRVVYDASCRGLNHISLNDELLVGPSLQRELRDVLMKWRLHKICFLADIIKMYRQILIRKEDTNYQRILFRFKPEDEVKVYRLLTVTFGTACAPYLAMKTLQQLAIDESNQDKFSLAEPIVLNDFYMDDVLSGSDEEDTAIEMKQQLTDLLKLGGFELQKWCSNSERFMKEVEPEKRTDKVEVTMCEKKYVGALGIQWKVKEDKLRIAQRNVPNAMHERITKRTVLSQIASLFDPMGWLAPCIVIAKIFMQKLWLRKFSWDEDLPDDIRNEWMSFMENIPMLSKLEIDRWMGCTKQSIIELHGFADASQVAYAGVVYARIKDGKTGTIETCLIMAKTKVAPVKQLSLPRLELCAAVLVCKLLKHCCNTLKIHNLRVFAWTDSQVVLAWINGDPNRWTPFVKNRVIDIAHMNISWSYITSKENPADPASRGISPIQLKDHDIWWTGPKLLRDCNLSIEKTEVPITDLETRKISHCSTMTVENIKNDEFLTFLKKYSSLDRLLHVVAYCRRWLHVLKKNKIKTNHNYITCEEKEDALTVCLRICQSIEFSEEIIALKTKKNIKGNSSLLTLNPYLDEHEILHVGGRLKHADVEYLRKHPVILTKGSALLPLLLDDAHKKTLHGGPQLMMAYLRNRFWIIKGGQAVKRFYRKCYTCARYNNATRNQIMGNLPSVRVNPSRPFSISGVDFAGPICCRMSKGRGAKAFKAYICIFICMSTKAIHIELVSDMSTEAFIAAFKRLVARRGHCKELWSDHGTTFIAAKKALLEMWQEGRNDLPEDLAKLLDDQGTRWVYIPPGAPNFGGLWEAGVKSTKYHLKRILGNSTLTFEELYTLLAQIEACLNSRPLVPLGEDLDYLTPAHFLIGESLLAVPEKCINQSDLTPIRRWHIQQHMVQSFWKKWQTEYLSRLQERNKWKSAQPEFEVGDLVLLRELRLPPATWRLGRIVKKYPGTDGYTRTYDVRTSSGILQRSVSRLCRLPAEG